MGQLAPGQQTHYTGGSSQPVVTTHNHAAPLCLQVSFKLFGLLPGAGGLRGRVVPVAAGQPHGLRDTAGERDTVKVLFEPPVLSLGDALHFRIGEAQQRPFIRVCSSCYVA